MTSTRSYRETKAIIDRALASHEALAGEIRSYCDRSRKDLVEEWDGLDKIERSLDKDKLSERPDLVKQVKQLQARKIEIQKTLAVLDEAYDGSLVQRTDEDVFQQDETSASEEPDRQVNLTAVLEGRKPLEQWASVDHHPKFEELNQTNTKPLDEDFKGVNKAWKVTHPTGEFFMKRAKTFQNPDHNQEELVPKLAHHFGLEQHFLPVKVHHDSEGVDFDAKGDSASESKTNKLKFQRMQDNATHVGRGTLGILDIRGVLGATKAKVITTDWVKGQTFGAIGGYDRESTPRLTSALNKVPEQDRYKLVLFDFLTGNNDRHSGNAMLSDDGQIKMIDHGLSFGAGNRTYGNKWRVSPSLDHPIYLKSSGLIKGLIQPETLNDLADKANHVQARRLIEQHAPGKLTADKWHREMVDRAHFLKLMATLYPKGISPADLYEQWHKTKYE